MTPIDETSYQIFAPNQHAMDEAKEIIEEILSTEVNQLKKNINSFLKRRKFVFENKS